MRATHIFQPEKPGGPYISFLGEDRANTGLQVHWQVNTEPGTVKEIAQILILDVDGNQSQSIPIPTELNTGKELIELLQENGVAFPVPRSCVIAPTDEVQRIQAMVDEIAPGVVLTDRIPGKVPTQLFAVNWTTRYYRALVKIGFHYAIKFIPTLAGNELEFSEVRQFIKEGIGEVDQFVRRGSSVRFRDDRIGHCLAAVAEPDSPILVTMQFFVGTRFALPSWTVNLGVNPTRLRLLQSPAHFFRYRLEENGRLVPLSVESFDPEP